MTCSVGICTSRTSYSTWRAHSKENRLPCVDVAPVSSVPSPGTAAVHPVTNAEQTDVLCAQPHYAKRERTTSKGASQTTGGVCVRAQDGTPSLLRSSVQTVRVCLVCVRVDE